MRFIPVPEPESWPNPVFPFSHSLYFLYFPQLQVETMAKSSAVSATNWRRDNDDDDDDDDDNHDDDDNSQLATSSFCRQLLLKRNALYFLKK